MTIRQARGHAYRALPTPGSPAGLSLVQLAAYLQEEGMGTLTNAKAVIPGAFPMLMSQQPQYCKPYAGPKALTHSRREVTDGRHALLGAPTCQALCHGAVKLCHLPSTSTPGAWAGRIIPTWKRERPALKSRVKENSPVQCPLAASLGLQPQPEKERAKACSRHSPSSLPGAQAKAWGRWSHYPADSPFLTPPHMRGMGGSGGVAIPCALRLPVCVLG